MEGEDEGGWNGGMEESVPQIDREREADCAIPVPLLC